MEITMKTIENKFAPEINEMVSDVISNYPDEVKKRLLELRELIYATAEKEERVNQIQETLKWGEPSYITVNPKTGTTIRIDWKESDPERYSLYLNCKTSLIEMIRMMYPNTFEFEGTRGIHMRLAEDLPRTELIEVIRMAFTYHLNK
jgi:hypothetical protein